jgi:hypothetical protein
MMFDAHQPVIDLHVDTRRRDALEQLCQCRLGKDGVIDRPVDGLLKLIFMCLTK